MKQANKQPELSRTFRNKNNMTKANSNSKIATITTRQSKGRLYPLPLFF